MTRTVTVQLSVEDAKAWHQVAKASPRPQHLTAAEVFRAGLAQVAKAPAPAPAAEPLPGLAQVAKAPAPAPAAEPLPPGNTPKKKPTKRRKAKS